MKPVSNLDIPVGVSLTHDKGSGRGRLGMRAKRFNPRVLGSMEQALKQAIRWRKRALREHNAAVAALPTQSVRQKVAKRQVPRRRRSSPK